MTHVTLSICVPTYNRADFLQYLLTEAAAWDFGFAYELVIADNASTDRTAAVVETHRAAGLPIRYFRQEFNKGSVANLMTGYHRARGDFVMYLADDDLLIPAQVSASIATLQARPDVCALYAPWELYDDINKRTSSVFYTHERDEIFEKGQEGDLFNFIVTHHIFPEIVIYRADAARKLLVENQFCFWAFSFLAIMIAQGAVAFVTTPFYRSVTLTPVQPHRSQAGVEQVLTFWDNYRGGLEYFIHSVVSRGGLSVSTDNKRAIGDMIDRFVAARMRVAVRLWVERRDFLRAYELLCRLTFIGPAEAAGVVDPATFRVMAFAQVLAQFANSIADLATVLFVGAADHASLGDLLRELGLRTAVAVTNVEPADQAGRDGTLVVLADEDGRARFLAAGYGQGLIISEADVMSNLLLPA